MRILVGGKFKIDCGRIAAGTAGQLDEAKEDVVIKQEELRAMEVRSADMEEVKENHAHEAGILKKLYDLKAAVNKMMKLAGYSLVWGGDLKLHELSIHYLVNELLADFGGVQTKNLHGRPKKPKAIQLTSKSRKFGDTDAQRVLEKLMAEQEELIREKHRFFTRLFYCAMETAFMNLSVMNPDYGKGPNTESQLRLIQASGQIPRPEAIKIRNSANDKLNQHFSVDNEVGIPGENIYRTLAQKHGVKCSKYEKFLMRLYFHCAKNRAIVALAATMKEIVEEELYSDASLLVMKGLTLDFDIVQKKELCQIIAIILEEEKKLGGPILDIKAVRAFH